MKSEKSFTLIELVIVLGLLAVLAVVVILAINPVEFLKQSRDSQRLSELQDINKSLGLYQAAGNTDLGQTNKVYVSLPSAYSDCSDLGLPSLPPGWSYVCSNSTNYRKVDSNGWLPVNLTSISFGAPLNILPIDPVNTTSTGNYYTYVIGGSWELNAILESSKYRNNASIVKRNLPGVFSVGSNLSLSPITNTSGLAAYWRLDEGTGTTAADSSGNNTATFEGGDPPTWTTGKLGTALNFAPNKASVYTGIISAGGSLDDISSAITIMAWVYPKSTLKDVLGFEGYNPTWGYTLTGHFGNMSVRYYPAAIGWITIATTNQMLNLNEWQHIAFTFTNSTFKFYKNGSLFDTKAGSAADANAGRRFLIGGKVGWTATDIINDEVRVYNRALSAAEIAAIYNATK